MMFGIKKYDENEYAYREIKENPIIIDFSACKYYLDIYKLLKDKLGLPVACGSNWSAIWDMLRDRFDDEDNFEVHIYGYRSMPEKWQEDCIKMLEIFDDVHKETPNVEFKLIS